MKIRVIMSSGVRIYREQSVPFDAVAMWNKEARTMKVIHNGIFPLSSRLHALHR